MKSLGIWNTSTVHSNRTSKCPSKDDKSLEKKNCGSDCYKFEEKALFLKKWHDNSVFTIAIFVPRPFFISDYNKYTRGVDHLN